MLYSTGPGTYQHGTTLTKKGGLMITKDRRFRGTDNENPGPGSYEVSIYIDMLMESLLIYLFEYILCIFYQPECYMINVLKNNCGVKPMTASLEMPLGGHKQ